ncbi:MAG TPA: tRNA (N6-threonylcarbamoyladenosine(37)-N6)-methyltransferase TrmO [Chloroflexi bacterium]|nr:tRNA (N6-threonylcarbamoyladenosine(37)-N6)-methyltransferase TrmO [Chloroflexota bacterium]
MEITYHPIGVIHSPFRQIAGMPIQSAGAAGVTGHVEVFPEYAAGLKDLQGFSHAFLLYHLHQVQGYQLTVTPFLDEERRGVFATRAPSRPNPIGLSVVRIEDIEGRIVRIEGVDILDGTPLLDIKPYIPEFDHHPAERVGWLESKKGRVQNQTSDQRFR